MSDEKLPEVAGKRLLQSHADFERACKVELSTEQAKPNPDNALIGLICDAVRLSREHVAVMKAPLGRVITWCPQCGPEPHSDEDGCCVMCGCDIGEIPDFITLQGKLGKAEAERDEARAEVERWKAAAKMEDKCPYCGDETLLLQCSECGDFYCEDCLFPGRDVVPICPNCREQTRKRKTTNE